MVRSGDARIKVIDVDPWRRRVQDVVVEGYLYAKADAVNAELLRGA